MGLPLKGNLLSLNPETPTFAGLAQTYGPILTLKLGSRLGVMVTPSSAREVLKENDITFANRYPPDIVRNAKYGGPDMYLKKILTFDFRSFTI